MIVLLDMGQHKLLKVFYPINAYKFIVSKPETVLSSN